MLTKVMEMELPPEKLSKKCPKRVILFIGPPTSGKSSQAMKIANYLGTEQKEEMEIALMRGRDIAIDAVGEQQARDKETQRKLVEDKDFCSKLGEELTKVIQEILILDNIPRTEQQAELLVEWVNKNDINLEVVHLKLTKEQMFNRVTGRQICSQCSTTYHPQLRPSQNEGLCDKDNTQLETRSGDEQEALKNGFAMYEKAVKELIPVLKKATNVKMKEINAIGTVDEAFQRFCNV